MRKYPNLGHSVLFSKTIRVDCWCEKRKAAFLCGQITENRGTAY